MSVCVCVCLKREGSYESWIRSFNDVSECCSLLVCHALRPPAKTEQRFNQPWEQPPPPTSLSPTLCLSLSLSLYTVVFFSLIITYRPDTSAVCLLLSVFLPLISSCSLRSFSWSDSAQTPSGRTPVAVIFLFITRLNNYFQLLLLFDFSLLGVYYFKAKSSPPRESLDMNSIEWAFIQPPSAGDRVCRAFRSLNKMNYVNALTH